ncbi:MAG: hypothetical protein GYA35_01190 [Thermoanaerobaculaceae bacterium]|nr:hypothetical protein [Thermoanaerobaculaceae bacterium]
MRDFSLNYYHPGKTLFSEYVENVIKDLEKRGVEKISILERVHAINNFNLNYAKYKKLDRGQIIEGRNELSLAMKVYNTIHTKENWN